jgi:hypothetical protein
MSDTLGKNWLVNIFDRFTKSKAGNRRRVDRYSSHVNLAFLEMCDKLRIIVHILPAHSTHKLQPLDVGFFSLLATYYSDGLNKCLYSSIVIVSMTKDLFYPIFKDAFQKAFTESNIKSAFEKTGIFPLHPEVILSTIQQPQPLTISPCVNELQTPKSCQSLCRMQKAYLLKPSKQLLTKLFNTGTQLAAQNSVNQHIITGLHKTINMERKYKKRTRLNLLGGNLSNAQFFSPSRVAAARDFQAQKRAAEESNRQRIIERKALAVEKKAECSLQHSIAQQQKEEEKIQLAATKKNKTQPAQAMANSVTVQKGKKRASAIDLTTEGGVMILQQNLKWSKALPQEVER